MSPQHPPPPPSPSPTSAAVADVLSTTELLEQILLSLPPRTLLPCTRVSRRWAATIASSHALQRALFLTPTPSRGALLPLNPPGQQTANRCSPADLPRALQPRVNELLIQRFRLGRFDEPDEDHDGGYMPMVSMRWFEELKVEAVKAKEEGGEGDGMVEPSWRRMLMAQPPPRRVEIQVYGTSMWQTVKAWVECEGGVTLGLLHDECQRLTSGRDWRKRSMGWFFEL